MGKKTMKQNNNGLVDPVDQDGVLSDQEEYAREMNSMSLSSLSLEDLKPIPDSQARTPNPFEGYPQKYKMVKGERINATHIVAFHPRIHIPQDPSGKNVSVISIARHASTGAIIKDELTGKPKLIEVRKNIETTHNRLIRDWSAGINIDVVFDREITLDDGKRITRIAFVPSPWVRAQLMFYYDSKTQKIKRDDKYLLFDVDQSARLRQCFQIIINPKLKAERDADYISGSSITDPGGGISTEPQPM